MSNNTHKRGCFYCRNEERLKELGIDVKARKSSELCNACKNFVKEKREARKIIYNYIEEKFKVPLTREIKIKKKTKEQMHHIKNKATKRKKEILERDNNICHYCGEFGNTIDHKQPISDGGSSTKDNLVCACLFCNYFKGNMLYDDFVSHKKKFEPEEWLIMRKFWTW